MSTLPVLDFSNGYDTDTAHSAMPANAMKRAENMIWRKSLDQRKGHRPYGTSTYLDSDVVRGTSERFYINSNWYSVEAIDLQATGTVRFYIRTTTGLTLVSASVEFTTGQKVCMAILGDHIVAVNGADKPVVIYYSAGWQIENLDLHDERVWGITTWNAGQFDDSEYAGAGTWFIEDTAAAQDATADDFELGNTTANDGFIIACATTFNKVVLYGTQQAGGAPVAEYAYWKNDNTWQTFTPGTVPTWTAAAGDRTIAWDYKTDAGRFNLESPSECSNYFLFRVRFTTAASAAFSCDYAAVHHTQYITEQMEDATPKYVVAHGSRLWMSTGYIVFYTPPNDVTGWRGVSESEYFLEGGPEIRGMYSHKEVLVIFKDNAVYLFYGSGIDTFQRKKISDHGLSQPGAFSGGGDEMYYLSDDGIRVLQGRNGFRVSSHIKTNLDGFTTTGATAIEADGEVYFSFPSSSIVLWFDPDTLTRDDKTGEGRVSFYKFTGYQVDYFIDCNGNGDTGNFLGVVNESQPYVARLKNGSTDQNRAATAAAIDFRFQSAYLSFKKFTVDKLYGLLKTKVKRDSSGPVKYAITMYADDGDREVSATFTAKAGTKPHVQTSRVPMEMDGKNLSIEIRSNELYDAGLRGFEVEYDYKEF